MFHLDSSSGGFTGASLRLGEQQARAEAQQCREEKVRLQAKCSSQSGLTGLIANKWMDEKGVIARVLKEITSRPSAPLETQKVVSYRSYRAAGAEKRGRVAVAAELRNLGAATGGCPTEAGAKAPLVGASLAPV